MATMFNCQERIVTWIKENEGYIYSQFSFLPEVDDEDIPTPESFEKIFHDVYAWEEIEVEPLNEEEQEKYPGATVRRKFHFSPLLGNAIAHTFENDDDVLYVIVHT